MATRVVFNQREMDRLFRSQSGPVGQDLARRARRVELAAKALAPVLTGTLVRSISSRHSGAGARQKITISASAPHAPYVEFGTARMRARPFLRPALAAAAAS